MVEIIVLVILIIFIYTSVISILSLVDIQMSVIPVMCHYGSYLLYVGVGIISICISVILFRFLQKIACENQKKTDNEVEAIHSNSIFYLFQSK